MMRTLFLCLVLSCAPLAAQSPTPIVPRQAAEVRAIVNGLHTDADAVIRAKPGDLLVLDASQSEGTDLKFKWKPPDFGAYADRKSVKFSVDGKRAFVPTWPGTWPYRLVVWNVSDVSELVVTVIVEPCGVPTPPVPTPVPPAPVPVPPQPGPVPVPVPPNPPAPSPPSFADQVEQWALGVNSPTRAAEARAIAQKLEFLAAKLGDGKSYKSTGTILAAYLRSEIVDACQTGAGPHLAEWQAAMMPLARAVGELLAAGELQTPAEWAAKLTEVVTGLRRLK